MEAEFQKLLNLSDRYLIKRPMLVGGMPRDHVLGLEKKTFDSIIFHEVSTIYEVLELVFI